MKTYDEIVLEVKSLGEKIKSLDEEFNSLKDGWQKIINEEKLGTAGPNAIYQVEQSIFYHNTQMQFLRGKFEALGWVLDLKKK